MILLNRIETKRKAFNTISTKHDPESRVRIAKEVDILRNGQTPIPEPKKPREIAMKDGRVLQRNDNKLNYKFIDTPHTIELVVEISKFMDTSLVNVDIQPTYIVVDVKGKILQLVLDEEVDVGDCMCERNKLNGALSVTMMKKRSVGKKLSDLSEERKSQATNDQRSEFESALEKQNRPMALLKKQLDTPRVPLVIKEVAPSRVAVTVKDDSLYETEEYSDVPPLC